MEKFVIFWGLNKDKSPFFESNMTIEDQSNEPINPEDNRVIKFPSEDTAELHLNQNYSEPKFGEILTIEEAMDIYEDYLTKIK